MNYILLNFPSMNKLILFSLLLFSLACVQKSDLQPKLETIMQSQQQSWNQGDIEGFMDAYLRSDSLLFIGGSGPQYGWKNTLERYKKAYPNPEIMGQLTFETTAFHAFDNENAVMSGKWHLKRKGDEVGGYFTLIWRQMEGEWKIIYDHTSSSRN